MVGMVLAALPCNSTSHLPVPPPTYQRHNVDELLAAGRPSSILQHPFLGARAGGTPHHHCGISAPSGAAYGEVCSAGGAVGAAALADDGSAAAQQSVSGQVLRGRATAEGPQQEEEAVATAAAVVVTWPGQARRSSCTRPGATLRHRQLAACIREKGRGGMVSDSPTKHTEIAVSAMLPSQIGRVHIQCQHIIKVFRTLPIPALGQLLHPGWACNTRRISACG